MIYKILKKLEETTSTNGKVELLKSHDSPLLQRVLYMALNKYLRYGFQTIPEPATFKDPPELITLDEALDTIEKGLTGKQRSKARELLISVLLARLKPKDADVLKRVILKDLQCGIAEKLVNKAFPKLIPIFDVLLAKPGKEKNLKKLNYPCMAQIKYDGARVNFDIDSDGNVEAFTRNGNLMDLFGRFNEFPEDACCNMIDGELIAYDKHGNKIPRKKSNGIITKATRGTLTYEDAQKLRFVAWDIVDRDNFKNQEMQMTPCLTRYENVKRLLEGYSDIIEIAECRIINSYEEALAYFNECVDNGEEGIILKNMDGVWELKRSNNLVKMKSEFTADLVIVGLNPGKETGNRKGFLGSFALETADGLLRVNCGSGLSLAQTVEYWDENLIGKIVEVKYNEQVSSEGSEIMSLSLPIFQSIRYDKDVANTLDELD